MASGIYTTRTNFRFFNLSADTYPDGGYLFVDDNILFEGTSYNSIFSAAFYDDPGSPSGGTRLFGNDFVLDSSNNEELASGTLQAIERWRQDGPDFPIVQQFLITGMSVHAIAAMDAWTSNNPVAQQALLRLIYQGNDTIALSSFADYAFGANGNDTMVGNDGNDTLFGQIGNDAIRGGFGDDFISGDVGNDRLTGGPGADFLQGGAGNDTLTGAADADLFVFRAGYASDTITDWTDGIDRIRLYGVINENQISITAIAGVGVQITAMDVSIVVLNADVADFQLIAGTGLFALA